MEGTIRDIGKKAWADTWAWTTRTTKSVKESLTPSVTTLRITLMVVVFLLIIASTITGIHYFGWLGLAAGICFMGFALLEFGLLKKNLRIPLFALVAIIPLLVFCSWAMSKIESMNKQSEKGKPTVVATDLRKPRLGVTILDASPTPPLTTLVSQTTSSSDSEKKEVSNQSDPIVIPNPIASPRIHPSLDPVPEPLPSSPPPPVSESPSRPTQVGRRMGDLNIFIKDCKHMLDAAIECYGAVDNEGEEKEELAFKEGGSAIDSEGNLDDLPLRRNGITFGNAGTLKMPPNTDVKFRLQFHDESHGKADHLTITIHARWNGVYGDVTFDPIPVS